MYIPSHGTGIGTGIGTQALGAFGFATARPLRTFAHQARRNGCCVDCKCGGADPCCDMARSRAFFARGRGASALHGACCTGCAQGKGCGGHALGAISAADRLKLAHQAGMTVTTTTSQEAGSPIVKLLLLAGIGVGGYFLVKKLRAGQGKK